MRDFFNDCNVQGRIDPRDAYFGGRTMAFKMLEKADEENEISMFDIVCFFIFYFIVKILFR